MRFLNLLLVVQLVLVIWSYLASACHPHPVLIKLTSAWDHRLVLASKRKLNEFRISHLFLREDLPLEERQKRKKPVDVNPTRSIETSGAAVEPLVTEILSN